jgi:hypothetical protein
MIGDTVAWTAEEMMVDRYWGMLGRLDVRDAPQVQSYSRLCQTSSSGLPLTYHDAFTLEPGLGFSAKTL